MNFRLKENTFLMDIILSQMFREAFYHSTLILIFSPLHTVLDTQMHTCFLSKLKDIIQLPRSQWLWGLLKIRKQFWNLCHCNLKPPRDMLYYSRGTTLISNYNMSFATACPYCCSAVPGFDTFWSLISLIITAWTHEPLHFITSPTYSRLMSHSVGSY